MFHADLTSTFKSFHRLTKDWRRERMEERNDEQRARDKKKEPNKHNEYK
jgi:hypothetical protein